MLLLEVPLTRPLAFRRRTLLAIYALATLIITIVTLLNVVAVGYELVPFTSDAFEAKSDYWYDRLIPTAWRPHARTCEGATIKVAEREFH